jgi:hypothetical protein
LQVVEEIGVGEMPTREVLKESGEAGERGGGEKCGAVLGEQVVDCGEEEPSSFLFRG